MIATWVLLIQSRKFWVGTITVMSIIAAVTLVAIGKLDASNLTATVIGLTAVGMTTIGSIAWEDTAKIKKGSDNDCN